jgi:hypothetical protein
MSKRTLLILGDLIALAVITVIGFATHGETDLALVPRMLTTFLPALAGWFTLAPFFGLFDQARTSDPKQLWRVAYVALLAAPLMAVLRAALLGAVALPLFVLIFGGSFALGMLIWRGLWWKFGDR